MRRIKKEEGMQSHDIENGKKNKQEKSQKDIWEGLDFLLHPVVDISNEYALKEWMPDQHTVKCCPDCTLMASYVYLEPSSHHSAVRYFEATWLPFNAATITVCR
jgi:hypothetical protein